jgi:microcystin degradation protein MlrC
MHHTPVEDKSMRVVTGGISHETSTFTLVQTNLQSFHERTFVRGPAMLQKYTGTNTPIGGFIDGAQAHGFELLPAIFAEAHPSAPVPRAIFDKLLDELLQSITSAAPVDGVLLDLHGAMVVGNLGELDGIDDPEGHILAAIRAAVGADVPILAQLDIHSNVSVQMIEVADVLIGRESYPEIDMADRGRECADVLARILRDGLRPTMAVHQIPMMWGMHQVTDHQPMLAAIDELHRIEGLPGVICGSIATCFPLADVPDMGASVYIATDNDLALAQSYADELGSWLYERRTSWHFRMPPTQEVLVEANAAGKFPVVFADRNDNTGGGSPGDSTGLLRTFVDAELEDACVLYMVDPAAIAACAQAGVGATLALDVGGKSHPLQGEPVRMTVEVMALADGRFRYAGPMYAGLESSMGPSAYIRQGGVHVVLVTQREQPFDTAFSLTLGLDPRRMRYIGIKSAAHFRAGFEAWAGAIYSVSESSVHAADHIKFQRLGRTVYPLQD